MPEVPKWHRQPKAKSSYSSFATSLEIDRNFGGDKVLVDRKLFILKRGNRIESLVVDTVLEHAVTDGHVRLRSDADLGTGEDEHFIYYPLYFVTRSYNIGKQKYYEEYLYDSSQRLQFAIVQYYDENGKRFDRRYYFHDGDFYHVIGPEPTAFMIDEATYQANDLRLAFDWIIQNPKE